MISCKAFSIRTGIINLEFRISNICCTAVECYPWPLGLLSEVGEISLAGEERVVSGDNCPPCKFVKKPWFPDQRKGSLTHWIWPRLLSKHFINFPAPHAHFLYLCYQSKLSESKNFRIIFVFNQQLADPLAAPPRPGAPNTPVATPLRHISFSRIFLHNCRPSSTLNVYWSARNPTPDKRGAKKQEHIGRVNKLDKQRFNRIEVSTSCMNLNIWKY